MLEVEITGDRNNFVELQKIFLEIRCKVTQANGADLRYDNAYASLSDSSFLVNNSLYSFFSDCTLSANGLKISNANGNFAHKSFIGTEFSNSQGAKDSWLKFQGYRLEVVPGAINGAEFTSQKELICESREVSFFGPAGIDFFTCDKHLLSGVTLRISYRRSLEDFLIILEDAAKHYKLEIIEPICKKNDSDRPSTLSYRIDIVENSCKLSPPRRNYKNISGNSWPMKLAT